MLPDTKKRDEILHILRSELPYLREQFSVERMALFGSFSKGYPKKRSDIDILVRLKKPLGLEFVRRADHLEHVLSRRVALVTFDTMKRSGRTSRYIHIAEDIKRTLVYV